MSEEENDQLSQFGAFRTDVMFAVKKISNQTSTPRESNGGGKKLAILYFAAAVVTLSGMHQNSRTLVGFQFNQAATRFHHNYKFSHTLLPVGGATQGTNKTPFDDIENAAKSWA
jgi:hypothetical protein